MVTERGLALRGNRIGREVFDTGRQYIMKYAVRVEFNYGFRVENKQNRNY